MRMVSCLSGCCRVGERRIRVRFKLLWKHTFQSLIQMFERLLKKTRHYRVPKQYIVDAVGHVLATKPRSEAVQGRPRHGTLERARKDLI